MPLDLFLKSGLRKCLITGRIRKVVAVVLVVSTLATIGFAYLPAKGKESGYRTARVTRGDIVSTVSAVGTVNPVETVMVGTQVSGTIMSIHADFNTRVERGDILARLDPAIFEARVEEAEGAVLSAEANLQRAVAALKDARRALTRARELFGGGHIPLSELESAETNCEIAEARVRASRGELARSKGALASAETNLGHTTIRSPITGVVISKNIEVGQTVAAGFQTPTLFTIARDLAWMHVECIVDEADIGRVAVGQPVEFTVGALPGTKFSARVSKIRHAPIFSQNVVSYEVLAEVDNTDLLLRPGMTANVTITTARVANILRIPNAALRFMSSRSGKSGGARVWIPGKEKLKRIDVKTGISDGTYTEMVLGGLREGMELAVETKGGSRKSSRAGSMHGVKY